LPIVFPPITVNKQGYSIPLDVRVRCAVPDEGIREHISHNVEHNLPEVGIDPEHSLVMAIACSGPSLFDSVDYLRDVALQNPNVRILAVKSSHDFLIDNGIIPWGCILLDGREHVKDMFRADSRVTYFAASMCAESTFDYLKESGAKIVVWHAAVGAKEGEVIKRKHVIIGGGSTSPLRAMPMGYTMGFRNFMFFGLDSCFTDQKIHYYLDTKKQDGTERAIVVRTAGREFRTTPEMIGQAQDFETLITAPQSPKFGITMVGDGLNKHRWDNRIYFPVDQVQNGNIPCYTPYQFNMAQNQKETEEERIKQEEEKKKRWNPNPLKPNEQKAA
jgi:hypothetical protein